MLRHRASGGLLVPASGGGLACAEGVPARHHLFAWRAEAAFGAAHTFGLASPLRGSSYRLVPLAWEGEVR